MVALQLLNEVNFATLSGPEGNLNYSKYALPKYLKLNLSTCMLENLAPQNTFWWIIPCDW
jgi:hypothetical protein